MRRKSDSKMINLLGAIALLIGVVAGFFWLWSTSKPGMVSVSTSKYQKVEIDSLKKDAETLVKDKENFSGMPLQAPTSDKVGRDNPFLSY